MVDNEVYVGNGEGDVFAVPRQIESVDECYFYHSMDIPGHGVVSGEWDLRGSIDDYLGKFDFAGKRVLDVGAASGILSFHMEKMGADVVSFDLSEEFDWDIVPFFGNDNDAKRQERRAHLRKINNGYWFCHQALQSKAKMANGVVYDIPETIGPVDVAVYGSILIHLRDPFLALQNGARLARETMIVADVSPVGQFASKYRKRPKFIPNSKRPNGAGDAWFKLPPRLVQEYLAILGFPKSSVTWKEYPYGDKKTLIYTVVAHR